MHNKAHQYAADGRRTPLSGRRCAQRYALKQMPLRQHAFVQDADNFNNTLGG
jgi:hypothetical protein